MKKEIKTKLQYLDLHVLFSCFIPKREQKNSLLSILRFRFTITEAQKQSENQLYMLSVAFIIFFVRSIIDNVTPAVYRSGRCTER